MPVSLFGKVYFFVIFYENVFWPLVIIVEGRTEIKKGRGKDEYSAALLGY